VKVVSWNLLRLTGATVEDVAAVIDAQSPDLLLMQEATAEIRVLPEIAGGHIYREPLPGRIYGLAAWSPEPLPEPRALPLPVSPIPGCFPPRLAQLVRHEGVTFANVHLSHGQFLNRRQLMRIAAALSSGPAAVIGDFNAVGPTFLRGFRDVGPREPTHVAQNVLPFRLDRCLVNGLDCTDCGALDRGASDHRPIVLELEQSGAWRSRADRRLLPFRRIRARRLGAAAG
jgi:endonuclease/exonuclease/phosphatase (EEP) superfamily protein YafD